MKQTGCHFCISFKNNSATRLDWVFLFSYQEGGCSQERFWQIELLLPFSTWVCYLSEKKKKKKGKWIEATIKKIALYREKVLCSAWPWPATLDISSGKCVSFPAWFVQVVKPYYYCKAYFTYTHKHKYAYFSYFYEVRGNKAAFVSSKYNSFLLA